VETLEQLAEALDAGARMILLDNMDLVQMRQAVGLTAGRAELEASGGVSLETVRAIAETGVDRISIGDLTKDVRSRRSLAAAQRRLILLEFAPCPSGSKQQRRGG
jgi:nicotinate-nucleotide pyrophosphorylase (carboxylating)